MSGGGESSDSFDSNTLATRRIIRIAWPSDPSNLSGERHFEAGMSDPHRFTSEAGQGVRVEAPVKENDQSPHDDHPADFYHGLLGIALIREPCERRRNHRVLDIHPAERVASKRLN